MGAWISRLATLVFYGLNNIEIDPPDDDAYESVSRTSYWLHPAYDDPELVHPKWHTPLACIRPMNIVGTISWLPRGQDNEPCVYGITP